MKRIIIIFTAVFLAGLFCGLAQGAKEEAGVEVLYNWDFKKGGGEWSDRPVHNIAAPEISEGVMKIECTGYDPYIFFPDVQIDALKFTTLIIKMKMDRGAGDAIFFITDEDRNWDENKKVPAPFAGDDQWHEYKIDMTQCKFWKGTVVGMRLDPPNEGNPVCKIAYIKITSKEKKFSGSSLPLKLVPAGETRTIAFSVFPEGADATNVKLDFTIPQGLVLVSGEPSIAIPDLKLGNSRSFVWDIKGEKPGIYTVKISIEGQGFPVFNGEGKIIVVAPAPAVQKEVPDRARVFSDEKGNVILENQKLRLCFVRSPAGYLHYLIYLFDEREWFLMGTGYPLGSVRCLNRKGEEQEIFLVPELYNILQKEGKQAGIQFPVQVKDAEGTWDFSFTLMLEENKTYVQVKSSLKSSSERQLLKFTGPFIYPGEGSFGSKKTEALFPGLEWLTSEEISSSELDIAPPYNIRHTPHPYKITVPVMSVEYEKHLIGLIWDPLQKWDQENICPTARFCSPNWIEGQDNHCMGLFLPSIPKWVEENGSRAATPYILKPGTPLTLSSYILAEYPLKPLFSLGRYVDIFGPLTLQPRPMTYEQEIDLIRETYMQRLWDREAKNWHYAFPIKSSWGQLVGPGYHSRFALTLWMDYLFNRNPAVKKSIKEMVDTAMQEFYDNYGPREVSLDLAFRYGHLEEAVQGELHRTRDLIKRQLKDGSWGGFMPNAQTKILGKRGQREIGFCAGPAAQVLKLARITGSQQALESGIKAMEYMKNFEIPRAAQTWECPVHSPDVYASYVATNAHIEGFLATGDKQWLERARYWAWSGLPFIYFWGAPDRPVMKGGSIAIFGASFFTGSWFGVPVQWNGMEYSYSLLRLAPYDRSFDWKTLGECIMLSGMHQQEKEGDAKGGFTDNWNLMLNSRCTGFILSPWWIALNLYSIIGEDMDVRTVILETEKGRLHLNSAAHISEAAVDSRLLKFKLTYPLNETYYSLICSLEKPGAVRKEGRLLNEIQDLNTELEGWKYDTETGFVYLKTRQSAQQISVEVAEPRILTGWKLPTGALPGFIPKKQKEMEEKPLKILYNWDFSKGDAQGWGNSHDLEEPDFSEGMLKTKATGNDPWIYSPEIQIDAKEFPFIIICMKSNKGKQFEIYFISEDSGDYSDDKCVYVPRAGSNKRVYVVDMSKCPNWKGKITGLRFDPAGPVSGEIPGAEIEVYYIKVANKPAK